MDWGRRGFRRVIGVALFTWIGTAAACLAVEDNRSKAVEPPPYGDFLVIPLRVHILSATDLPDIDCALSDSDIQRILGKVNTIWHQAGIHWGLEALIREPAARQERFKKHREARGDTSATPLGLYPLLVPEASKTKEGLHVYYIHEFSVNGVYLGNATAFVQETARLRSVEGGIDEPLPRVTAHELGHSLGLPHRQDRTNLLASGTTGTSLNADEVERARGFARTTPGVWTVDELGQAAKVASQTGRTEEARRFRSHLASIPGHETRDREDRSGKPIRN